MSSRMVGHKATADPTGTFCVVPGCGRFLSNVKGEFQHRRGSGGRRRTLTPNEIAAATPAIDLSPILDRLDRVERTIERIEQSLAVAPRPRVDIGLITEAFNETIMPVINEIDDVRSQVANLRLDVQRLTPGRVPAVGSHPAHGSEQVGGWRDQRPDRSGHTARS